jgi:hypothetical protein
MRILAYRRESFTRLVFAGLLTVGFFQAALGAVLPDIRPAEDLSYARPLRSGRRSRSTSERPGWLAPRGYRQAAAS